MKNEERDEWAGEVLERIRLHQRRVPSGMFAMLDDGLLDIFDCLAVAPLIVAGGTGEGSAEFEERRAAKLAAVAADEGGCK